MISKTQRIRKELALRSHSPKSRLERYLEARKADLKHLSMMPLELNKSVADKRKSESYPCT